jgi:hypothetical protein
LEVSAASLQLALLGVAAIVIWGAVGLVAWGRTR